MTRHGRRALLAAGIAVSIGHTNANGDTCYAALEAGADHFTHTFNAMSPLTHRGVGAAGAALASDAYAELIADGFHVDARLFPLMRRAFARRKLNAVSVASFAPRSVPRPVLSNLPLPGSI